MSCIDSVWEGSSSCFLAQLSSIEGIWEGSINSLLPQLSSIGGIGEGSITIFSLSQMSTIDGKVLSADFYPNYQVLMAYGKVVFTVYHLKILSSNGLWEGSDDTLFPQISSIDAPCEGRGGQAMLSPSLTDGHLQR